MGLLGLTRAGHRLRVMVLIAIGAALAFGGHARAFDARPGSTDAASLDCPHPDDVCRARQAVFPVSSFDPVGSATRIGADLLVTNRHVVGDRRDAVVHTPAGPKAARVVPSAYAGDLALLQVDGLPDGGWVPDLRNTVPINADSAFYAIGADIGRGEVRVFRPGGLIASPAPGADLGRYHVRALMQPGVSGGAVVDASGALLGIAVGGGDGRFEVIPAADVGGLLALRTDPSAETVTRRLGVAYANCAAGLDASGSAAPSDRLIETCSDADNAGQLLKAGRVLSRIGDFNGAIRLHRQAATQVPNALNARLSLLVSLQLGGRFEDMIDHARAVMDLAPDDPQVLRFAIQAGVWGGVPDLAEQGYEALLSANPQQAQAARRFIDAPPPRPARR